MFDAAERPGGQEEARGRVSLDGKSFVEVPLRLQKLISIALKLQGRIDAHLQEANLDFDARTDIVKGMNCHKVALFARGDISFADLTEVSVEAERNGRPEILRLADAHPDNFVFTAEDIREFVSQPGTEFPMTGHFLVQKGARFEPAHSFIILGVDDAGRVVCFHKAGPHLDMPFELAPLEAIAKPYDSLPGVVLIAPMGD